MMTVRTVVISTTTKDTPTSREGYESETPNSLPEPLQKTYDFGHFA